MAVEGTFWCENFLVADPFLIPLGLLLFNLLNLQISIAEYWKAEEAARKLGVEPPKSGKYLLRFYRAGAIGLSVVACFTPSAVTWFWLCSSVAQFGINVLLYQPAVKRRLGIPIHHEETGRLLNDLLQSVKLSSASKK